VYLPLTSDHFIIQTTDTSNTLRARWLFAQLKTFSNRFDCLESVSFNFHECFVACCNPDHYALYSMMGEAEYLMKLGK